MAAEAIVGMLVPSRTQLVALSRAAQANLGEERARRRRVVVIVAVALLAAGCSRGDDDETATSEPEDAFTAEEEPESPDASSPPITSSAEEPEVTGPTSTGAPADQDQSTEEAGEVPRAVSQLLAQVYSTSEEGDGIGTGCNGPKSDDQSLEISDSWGSDPADWGTPVVLCLYGFRDDLPIQLSTSIDGAGTWVTTLEPSNGARHPLYPGAVCTDEESAWCARPRESREFLFEDATRPIYRSPEGPWLATNDWIFATHLASDIEDAGGFRVEVSQGDVGRSFHVLPTRPREDYGLVSWLEESGGTNDELVIYGYERGEEIPLGLYVAVSQGGGEVGVFTRCPRGFRLMSVVGSIRIPQTGFATFRIPADLLDGMRTGAYSIAGPPLHGGYGESALWTDGARVGSCQVGAALVEEPFEGALRFRHYGDRVENLNRELARRGYLDLAGDNDFFREAELFDVVFEQFFSSRTRAAVEEFQLDNGLVVDGIAGPQTHGALGIPY